MLKPIATIAALSLVSLYFLGQTATSEDTGMTDKPRPNVEFEVIKDESDQFKRSVEVLLPNRISEQQLAEVAAYLHQGGEGNTFIGYQIDGDSDYGYWATTNYTPDLSVRVIGTASELGTDMESQSVSADTGEISREEYGENWPFTVDSGRLECWRGPAAVFVADGTVYQLNGVAKQMGHAPIDPIWRDNPAIPGTKISLGPVIQRALKLCN